MGSPQTLSETDRRRVAAWAANCAERVRPGERWVPPLMQSKPSSLADPDRPEAVEEEIRWQLEHMSAEVRAALGALPPVSENSSGPLGPGPVASGQLGGIVRDLQARLSRTDSDYSSGARAQGCELGQRMTLRV
jgi:hypothetical protein